MSSGKHQLSDAGIITRGENYYPPYVSQNDLGSRKGIIIPRIVYHSFGAVLTADPDGICEAQNSVGAGALTINGALASGGAVTLDVPRALVVDSGGADTATITIVGADQYGDAMSEAITLNGTTAVLGQKAFKTITSVTTDGAIANSAFVGTTDILGLPFVLSTKDQIINPIMDGAYDAVTAVVADATTATTTTNDVRGTVDFATASNDTRRFAITYVISTSDGKEAIFGVDNA